MFTESHVASRTRRGGAVLSMLTNPLCVPVLRAHLDGPLRAPDVRERVGAAQAAMRGQIDNLRRIGALERQVRGGMPYTVENELTDTGRSMLSAAEAVESWLAHSPRGPIAPHSASAKEAIMALVGGWSTTILHSLATRPLCLTELSNAVPEVSYPSIQRRLSAMRATAQVELLGNGDGRKSYAVTRWTREAVGPLLDSGRCERTRHSNGSVSLTPADIEACLRLSLPLASAAGHPDGSCLLVIESSETGFPRPARLHVDVEGGHVASSVTREERAPTRALGSVEAWTAAIVDGRPGGLRIDGDHPQLPRQVLAGLHRALRDADA